MKKYIITLFVSLMTIFSYGQSVYMHEAQQEAEENEISFGETILGAILFFGVIYVISKLSYRKSDSEHNHISNINPYDYSMDEKDWEEEERQERDWKIKSQILDEIEDMDDFMTVEPPYEGVNDDLKYNYATLEFVALSEVSFYEIFKSVKGKRIDGYEIFKNIGAVYKKYYNHDIIW